MSVAVRRVTNGASLSGHLSKLIYTITEASNGRTKAMNQTSGELVLASVVFHFPLTFRKIFESYIFLFAIQCIYSFRMALTDDVEWF